MADSPSTDAAARKLGLPPVAEIEARLLILGSLPGDRSLAEARYYAHPQNQFWRLLAAVMEEPSLPGLDYEDRLRRLQARGIALWDVVHAAVRPGSLDQRLSEVEARDLSAFARGLPQLRAIAFNGGTAARIGRKALGETPLALIDLPSSSPAYTLPFAAKAERWAALRAFLD